MKLIRRSMMMCCLLVFFVYTTHVLTSGNVQNQKVSKKDTNTVEGIADPKIEEIRRIRTAEDWPNPIVVVNSDSFYLITVVDGERVQEELNLADLEKTLKELKQEKGLRFPVNNEKTTEKAKEVKQMLELYKVMIELWPSG